MRNCLHETQTKSQDVSDHKFLLEYVNTHFDSAQYFFVNVVSFVGLLGGEFLFQAVED